MPVHANISPRLPLRLFALELGLPREYPYTYPLRTRTRVVSISESREYVTYSHATPVRSMMNHGQGENGTRHFRRRRMPVYPLVSGLFCSRKTIGG
jgi:hypothetical protein